ncbi:putative N-formylglutamate amidohydrolase [Amaricoccus macauensis]|uniref:Putative N-formylglutamate amidohydrolase n=1 Tax=Amaricoccus macauensis TaxID=57001 RepID=A0A840SFL6_9RHOB|nr:N-formylglutamate amidohydrolase [Amaricoccus macauensis]MBB5220647.1 putative N-formylglutamate amidohydrolase [Amaricoccus macauensis]
MDEAVYDHVAGQPGSRVLLLCDHASNAVPSLIEGGLGLSEAEMGRHIAYDIGARGLTLGLARRLGAEALLTRFSRLVIDPNRGEDDPTLVMRLYDGTVVPGNRHPTAAEVERRLTRLHRPYHDAVDAALDRVIAGGQTPAIVSIHSFTPQLKGRPPRPWQVGILWHRDGRLARPLMARLRAEGLCVGDNEPYSGELEGDTLSRHGTKRELPHVLIEVRQDLIATPEGEEAWAARLAPVIGEVIAEAGP